MTHITIVVPGWFINTICVYFMAMALITAAGVYYQRKTLKLGKKR